MCEASVDIALAHVPGQLVEAQDQALIQLGCSISDELFGGGDSSPKVVIDGASLADLKLVGLRGWIADWLPAPGVSFWGLDRSWNLSDRTRPTRLSGHKFFGLGENRFDTLQSAVGQMLLENMAQADHHHLVVFVGPDTWTALEAASAATTGHEYFDEPRLAGSPKSFTMLADPNRADCSAYIKVYADQSCPEDRAFILDMRTWTLASVGEIGREGVKGWCVSGDKFVLDLSCHCQLYCDNPGANAVLKF